jgi:putative flippase GtrA
LRDLATLARSMLATGAATVTDLATLTLLVSAGHVSPRAASVPSLVLASAVSFVANRRFAFGVRGHAGAARQLAMFAAVQCTTIALNALVFDVAMRLLGPTQLYWLVRLAVSNVVYLAWSFPMLRRIFDRGTARLEDLGASADESGGPVVDGCQAKTVDARDDEEVPYLLSR